MRREKCCISARQWRTSAPAFCPGEWCVLCLLWCLHKTACGTAETGMTFSGKCLQTCACRLTAPWTAQLGPTGLFWRCRQGPPSASQTHVLVSSSRRLAHFFHGRVREMPVYSLFYSLMLCVKTFLWVLRLLYKQFVEYCPKMSFTNFHILCIILDNWFNLLCFVVQLISC